MQIVVFLVHDLAVLVAVAAKATVRVPIAESFQDAAIARMQKPTSHSNHCSIIVHLIHDIDPATVSAAIMETEREIVMTTLRVAVMIIMHCRDDWHINYIRESSSDRHWREMDPVVSLTLL